MYFDPNQINALMNFLPKEAMKNLFNPTTEVIGKGLAGILYFVFQKPLEFGIVEKKHLNDLCKMTSEELIKIPKKNRDRKGLGLALKAAEESKYSLSDDELRKWFSKLIVTSLDDRKNSSLTPYYSTILSNLNGQAAKFLLNLTQHSVPMPLCKINKSGEKGSLMLQDNVAYWNWGENKEPNIEPLDSNIVEVLSSFNIIKIDYNSFLSSDIATKSYNEFKNSLVFNRMALLNAVTYHNIDHKTINDTDTKQIPFYQELDITKGILQITEFGKLFIRATMPINEKQSKVCHTNL